MTELERVARHIAKGDWTQGVRVASGETQIVYVIDGGTMRELRACLSEVGVLDAKLDRAATFIHHLRPFHRCEDHAGDDVCRVMAALNGLQNQHSDGPSRSREAAQGSDRDTRTQSGPTAAITNATDPTLEKHDDR